MSENLRRLATPEYCKNSANRIRSYASRRRILASCLRKAALQKAGPVPSRNDYRKDAALRTIYEKQMLDHVVKQQFELAPTTEESTGVFYLPRHVVKNERGMKIKRRVVFDASSSEGNSLYLNDVLEMGPNLLPEALATLLRFREKPVAIIGDIQQAFLQLPLDRKDRDLTRFLWYRISQDDKGNNYTTNEVVTYRFTRLPFGLTCSPFLPSATVREIAIMCREVYSEAVPLIDSNMFMDDFIAGNGTIGIYYELTTLMETIKLPLAKWATSCEERKEIWKAEVQEIQRTTQALGFDWNTESDTLSVDPRDILDNRRASNQEKTASNNFSVLRPLWAYFRLFPLSGRYSSKKHGVGSCSGRRFCPMTLELAGMHG
jgi:hypothetical protein